MRATVLAGLLALIPVAVCNLEKAIFSAPAKSTLLQEGSVFSQLFIHTFTRDHPSLRTNLKRKFPSTGGNGLSSWVLLSNLTEHQRYEFRVSWSALEPTSFNFNVYSLNEVLQDKDIIHSLQKRALVPEGPTTERLPAEPVSAMLVEIQAAADYFTDHEELMKNPPPVLVDLVLDPYLFNAIPHSLLPIVAYLVLVGMVTWVAARWIVDRFRFVAGPPDALDKKQK